MTLANDVDVFAHRSVEYRTLRQRNRIRTRGTGQDDPYKLARCEAVISVGKLGTRGIGTGIGVGFVITKIHFADRFEPLSIARFQSYDVARLGYLQRSRRQFLLQSIAVAFGNRKINMHRIGLRHGREQTVAGRVGERAFDFQRAPDHAGNGCGDAGIAEIDLGTSGLRVGLFVLRLGDIKRGRRCIPFFLADRFGVKQRL